MDLPVSPDAVRAHIVDALGSAFAEPPSTHDRTLRRQVDTDGLAYFELAAFPLVTSTYKLGFELASTASAGVIKSTLHAIAECAKLTASELSVRVTHVNVERFLHDSKPPLYAVSLTCVEGA
jgi:hypothetical protein